MHSDHDDRWRPSNRSRSRSRSRDRHYKRNRNGDRYDDRHRSRSPRWRSRSPPPSRRRHASRSPSRGRSPPRPSGRRSISRSPPPYRRPHSPAPYPSDVAEAPEPGTILRGRVVSVRPFGVFVELPGYRKQGLVHHSQVSEELRLGRDDEDEAKVKSLEYFAPPGEPAFVKVVEVKGEGRDLKVGCSMKAVDQETGADLDPNNQLTLGGGGGGPGGGRQSDAPPELHSVHSGVVQSVKPFGVFVQLDGFRKYALVHTSQISDHLFFSAGESDAERIAAISEVVAVGELVKVKIVEVTEDERGPKVGGSIKLVSQRDGVDLDPSNVKYRPRGEGGAPGGPAGGPIGAAAGAAHDAQIDWGHLKADVVQYGGGDQRYDILAADDSDAGAGQMPPLPREPPPAGTGANTAPLPPRGRGIHNVLPAWMTAGGKDAAPGSSREVGEGDRPIRTMEEAVAVLEEAGVKYKTHEHRHKHRHEHKHKRSSKDKKHKKDKKHRKSSKKSRKDRHRRRSDSLSSRDSSGRRRRYHRDDVPARHGH